jgi:hypothetical protein
VNTTYDVNIRFIITNCDHMSSHIPNNTNVCVKSIVQFLYLPTKLVKDFTLTQAHLIHPSHLP